MLTKIGTGIPPMVSLQSALSQSAGGGHQVRSVDALHQWTGSHPVTIILLGQYKRLERIVGENLVNAGVDRRIYG